MNLFTFKNTISENSLLKLQIPKNIKFNKILIVSSCFYSIFYNNKLVQFGPYRRTNYFLNENELFLEGDSSLLEIKVMYYGIPTFDLDSREFIFGINIFNEDEKVLSTKDIVLKLEPTYIRESNKFSFQRGFIERYDLSSNNDSQEIELIETNSAKIISSYKDSCLYNYENPTLISKGLFKGFDNEFKGYNHLKEREKNYDIVSIVNSFKTGYKFYKFKFKTNITGILHLKAISKSIQTIYLVFDEYLPNDKWIYSRSTCNDLLEIKLKEGNNEVFSMSPYTYSYLMVLAKDDIEIELIESVKIQNDLLNEHKCDDENINKVLEASKNSFAQNAFDMFTDCPSRERAGWLCDSYFLGLAESFYTSNHNIEKSFLENFAYGKFPEIVEGMIPMCFPSIHQDHTFIPAWALWFIIEIDRYFKETNDTDLVTLLKERVFGILNYFEKFENEYGLLENLKSWEFIEWSKATEDDYLKPVSFATNMLYKAAIECAGNLYKNESLLLKSQSICDTINKLSFNGTYFLDNARRVNGKLVATEGLISETNQYFAYFFNIRHDEKFLNTILNATNDNSLVPSAVFIGRFVRLLILYNENKYDYIINEYVPYFLKMANLTGTLWEKENPNASCNHGFTAVLGMILYNSIYKN